MHNVILLNQSEYRLLSQREQVFLIWKTVIVVFIRSGCVCLDHVGIKVVSPCVIGGLMKRLSALPVSVMSVMSIRIWNLAMDILQSVIVVYYFLLYIIFNARDIIFSIDVAGGRGGGDTYHLVLIWVGGGGGRTHCMTKCIHMAEQM